MLLKLLAKMDTVIIFFLSLPLLMYYYSIHIKESVILKSETFGDKFFMERFNLIDRQHVNDFIKWNNEYKNRRSRKIGTSRHSRPTKN